MPLMTRPIISAARRAQLENDHAILSNSLLLFLCHSMHYNKVESGRLTAICKLNHKGSWQFEKGRETDARQT